MPLGDNDVGAVVAAELHLPLGLLPPGQHRGAGAAGRHFRSVICSRFTVVLGAESGQRAGAGPAPGSRAPKQMLSAALLGAHQAPDTVLDTRPASPLTQKTTLEGGASPHFRKWVSSEVRSLAKPSQHIFNFGTAFPQAGISVCFLFKVPISLLFLSRGPSHPSRKRSHALTALHSAPLPRSARVVRVRFCHRGHRPHLLFLVSITWCLLKECHLGNCE